MIRPPRANMAKPAPSGLPLPGQASRCSAAALTCRSSRRSSKPSIADLVANVSTGVVALSNSEA